MTILRPRASRACAGIACALLGLTLAGCDQIATITNTIAAEVDKRIGMAAEHSNHAADEKAEPEKGPQGGKLLRDGDFAVELTIFEDNVDPEYRVYAYKKGEPIPPSEVDLKVELTRLGGRVDKIAFKPQGDFLRGDQTIVEPHSFDVFVEAAFQGSTHKWTFESYEGRTKIEAASAEGAGVKVETVGAVEIPEILDLPGRLALAPEARAEVKPWYAGRVVEMSKRLGQSVKAGEVVARVEASDTLRVYDIKAPISGMVVERNANVGDVPSTAIYVIADPARLQASLFAYPKDATRIKPGQPVAISGPDGQSHAATVATILPNVDPATQRVSVLAEVKNADGAWRSGMAVEGQVTISLSKAEMAVRTRALQRFRDFTVVFTRVGETYEVRMLELGKRSPEWTEVLGGIEPGAPYVSDNAFLIRADVEKSGASHDH